MNKLLTFSFIGGDLRQIRMIESLAAEGYHIRTYGFSEDKASFGESVIAAANVRECVSGADVIVLPLPYSVDKKTVNMPLGDVSAEVDEVISYAGENAIIFAGKIDESLTDKCRFANIRAADYAKRDEFAIMNAIPTAESALEIAMANTPFTLHGSKCLVVGYGRIGKILSADLRFLGAEVTATARKCSDLAWIAANDFSSARTSELSGIVGEFDIIFNTVPHMVLDFKVLSKTKPGVLIIDLASRPGGVDFDVARELSRKVIWALSLPGKVAPDTAGEIIKNTIMNILEEE